LVKKLRILSWVFLFLLVASYGEELHGHGAREGAIGPETLQELVGKIKLLDVRSKKDYEKEHIDTALVIPLKEISEARLTQLGFLKTDEIVVYAKSEVPAKKAKLLLGAMGFTAVKILSGGFVHWKEDGFPTISGKMDVDVEEEKEKKVSSISFQPAEYDFGILAKQDGHVTTTFSLSNKGNKKVRIEEISTSCGCTTAKVAKKVILPGEKVPLEVTFDPNFHKEPEGRFSRTVFLETSEGIELEPKIWVEIKD
jgi:rhodanese-related sulfurtransferase